MTLKQRLLAADLGLTEADFSTHESDLYVTPKAGVYEWLKVNYAFPKQVFRSNALIEIYFGYMDEFVANKQRRILDVDEFGATAEDRRQLAAHGIAWGD